MNRYLDYALKHPVRNLFIFLTVVFFIWMVVEAAIPASTYYDQALQKIENKGLWQKAQDFLFGSTSPDQLAHAIKQQHVARFFWLTLGCGTLAIVTHFFSYFWFRVLFIYALITGVSAIYDALPIDFLPNFIPLLGGVDNALVDIGGDATGLAFVLWQVRRRVKQKEQERLLQLNQIIEDYEQDQNPSRLSRRLMLVMGERSLEDDLAS